MESRIGSRHIPALSPLILVMAYFLGGGGGGGGGFVMVVIPRLLGASIGSFAMTHSLDSSLLSGSTNSTIST